MRAGLTAALVLVSAQCGGAPTESARLGVFKLFSYARDPARVSLVGDAARVEGAYITAIREVVMPLEKTDEVVVTRLDAPLVFEGLALPAGTAFQAELRAFQASALGQEELEVELEFSGRGWSERQLRTVRLAPETDTGVSLTLACETAKRVEAMRLVVRAPRPELAGGQPRAVWVRPRARYPLQRFTEAVPEGGPVIWITLDTLRRDALGVYGGDVDTPHLDRLAGDSYLFEEAYTTTNLTNPSHVSMFTSLYQKDHGVADNFTKLPPECPTLMEGLREAGYRTAGFVSSFNFKPEVFDLGARFDEFHDCEVYFERRAEDVNGDLIPWLERNGREPFFAWVHYFDAHMPYAAPSSYRTEYTPSSERVELPLRDPAANEMYAASDDLAYWRSAYLDEVRYLDDQVGELLAALEALGLYERATIVAVADHGEQLGENHIYCEHRGLYEPTIGVPAMIKLPGRPGGRVCGLVSTVDLYPTLFANLGLSVPERLRGRDLSSELAAGESRRARAFAEHAGNVQVSVRTESYHALLGLEDEEIFPRFAIEAGRFELYGRESPCAPGASGRALGEGADLLVAEPEAAEPIRERLGEQLREFLERRIGFDGGEIDDPVYLEMMRALGYTGASTEAPAGDEAEAPAETEQPAGPEQPGEPARGEDR